MTGGPARGRLTGVLRGALGPDLAFRLRQLGRVRFLAKRRHAAAYGLSPREDPKRWLAYVLTDPEVGDFTYALADRDAFAADVAVAIGAQPARVRELFAEVDADPELTTALTRRVRFRFDTKRRIHFGIRYAHYALVRLARPGLVVETGIRHGIGSVLLLRALAANAAEGHPGRLVSFDKDPRAGWLVPEHLRADWEVVVGDTRETIDATLAGRAVDLVVHDSMPTLQATEFGAALANRGPGELWLLVGTFGGQLPDLAELAAAHGASHTTVVPAVDHFYPGEALEVARFPRLRG